MSLLWAESVEEISGSWSALTCLHPLERQKKTKVEDQENCGNRQVPRIAVFLFLKKYILNGLSYVTEVMIDSLYIMFFLD